MRPLEQMEHWLGTQPSGKGRTLLELLGKDRAVVERHRGIQCYSEEEIVVKTSYGILVISGNDLRLCCMSREQLCIRGSIDGVKLIGRDTGGTVE